MKEILKPQELLDTIESLKKEFAVVGTLIIAEPEATEILKLSRRDEKPTIGYTFPHQYFWMTPQEIKNDIRNHFWNQFGESK